MTVPGRGRGKGLGTPTINLDLWDIPQDLDDGVYACMASVDGDPCAAVMHLGPRPTFGDGRSGEVHLLDTTVTSSPIVISIEVIARLRTVQTFPTPEALKEQIAQDIAQARAILLAHASSSENTDRPAQSPASALA